MTLDSDEENGKDYEGIGKHKKLGKGDRGLKKWKEVRQNRLKITASCILKPKLIFAKEGASYAVILQRMNEDHGLNKLAKGVTRSRKNAAGDLMIVLDKKAQPDRQKLCHAIQEKVQDLAETKTLMHQLEIKADNI